MAFHLPSILLTLRVVDVECAEDTHMLTSLLHTVNCLFCDHEWITHSQSTRLYLECVKCLAISNGIDVRRELAQVAPPVECHTADHGLATDRLVA